MVARFPELTGDVFSPSNKGCLVPIHIHQEAEQNILGGEVKTTVIDSVTKIYGFNTRPAIMAGRMSPKDREQFGFSKNKASNLQNKADAIQVLTYLAGYGTNIFYIWHEQETVDMESARSGKLDTIMRESMSPEERKRLFTSVDIVLRFAMDKGRYAVTVDPETRGYGTVPNTGFTIYDPPGNFWRGALARLYCLIYTSFDSKGEAVSWGMEKLGRGDTVEMEAFYEEVKVRAKPETPSEMWVAWMLALEEKFLATEYKVEKPVDVQPPKTEPTPPAAPPPPAVEQGPDNTDAIETPEAPDVPDELEGLSPGQIDEQLTHAEDLDESLARENAHALGVDDEDIDEALGTKYTGGDEVDPEDREDFFEYRRRFQKIPYDATLLKRAKELNEDWT
jgi:hypothetical protein